MPFKFGEMMVIPIFLISLNNGIREICFGSGEIGYDSGGIPGGRFAARAPAFGLISDNPFLLVASMV
jgi:hypothetical protein